MSDKTIFVLDGNDVKYINNNKLLNTGKTINNLSLTDFNTQGNIAKINEIDKSIGDKITILSTESSLQLQLIQPSTFICNNLNNQYLNINSIKRFFIEDIGNIKYLFYNGANFFSWYNNEWGRYNFFENNSISNQDIYNISIYGMTSNTINNLQRLQFKELWTEIDSRKFIDIIAVFNQENFDEQFSIKKITLTKDNFEKGIEIKNHLFDEEQTLDEIIVKWNTTNKSKIKIIYGI